MSYVLSVLSETDIGKSDGGAARRIGNAGVLLEGVRLQWGENWGSGMNLDVLFGIQIQSSSNFSHRLTSLVCFSFNLLGGISRSISKMELERTNSFLQ